MGLHVYTVHIIHIGIEYTLQGVGFYEVDSWLQSTPKLYACFNNDTNINDILYYDHLISFSLLTVQPMILTCGLLLMESALMDGIGQQQQSLSSMNSRL